MHYFTDEHEMVRDMVRSFAEKELAPIAARIDEEDRFPAELLPKLAQQNLLGMAVPVELGGGGADTLGLILAIEEVARVSGSVALLVAAHNALVCPILLAHATDAQKQRYLTPLARGDVLGAFGLSEAGAGSDAGAVATTAVRQGDAWIVDGAKKYVPGGSLAKVAVLAVKSDDPGGVSALICDCGGTGYTVAKRDETLGLRGADTVSLAFKAMPVPAENRLGAPGQALPAFLAALDIGRIAFAAIALGIARAALENSVSYSETRTAFGRPLSGHQAIQNKIANMATEVEAARYLVHQAAIAKDRGQPFSRAASMAKLFASEAAMRASTEAVQIHGGYGYMREYPVERFYRDAKVCEVGFGTNEIQRLVIARALLPAGFAAAAR